MWFGVEVFLSEKYLLVYIDVDDANRLYFTPEFLKFV
jgi:hypothetical protein